MNIQHTISTDLVLKAAPWVQASKDAEAATAGVVKQAENLDRAIATKLNPHIKDLAASFKLGRDALFGYEQQLDRTARANDRLATSANNASRATQLQQNLARAGGQFAQGAAQMGVGQFVGGGVAQLVNPAIGGLVGNAAGAGLSLLSGPALAVAGTFAALGIAAKTLVDDLNESGRRLGEGIDSALEAMHRATAERQAAESRVGDLGGRLSSRQSVLDNRVENRAFYEAQLTERTQELAAARASLAEQEKLLASSQARIVALQAGRIGAQNGVGDAAFRMAQLASPGDESVTLARVQQLATEARRLQSGGNQDAARDKFAEAQQLLQQLFQSLGAPIDRLAEFQSAIASLGAEIDASFQASLDSASTTAASASASIATLTESIAVLDAKFQETAINLSGIAKLLANDIAEITNLSAQLTAAQQQLSAANVSEVAANQALANVEGMAVGGRSKADNQLALLSVGEVVLNRAQQNALGGASALRRAGVPGFADGGGFRDMLEGTRRFTAASEAAGSIDAATARSGWNDMANALMSQGLSYRQAWDTINRRKAAGLPPVFPGFTQTPTVAASLGNVQSFATGGVVQPTSTVRFGDMHFDMRGSGANEATARDMARTIRRQVRLGISKY